MSSIAMSSCTTAAEPLPEQSTLRRRQPGRGLVEEDDCRTAHQGAGHADQLLLAERQLGGANVALRG